MPESPRWLCYKDRFPEALQIMSRLEAKPIDDPQLKEDMQVIIDTIAAEKETDKVGWREIFSGGEQQNFRRIILGAGTSVFQQLGGINVAVYYLPVILMKSFGFSARMALILSAVDFISLCFWGLMISFVIERVGRKNLMFWGALGEGICFAMAAIGLGIGTKTMNGVAVAFIFLYHVFFVSFPIPPDFLPCLEANSKPYRDCRSFPFHSCIHPRSTLNACETPEIRLPC
jgi:hypothetical protein